MSNGKIDITLRGNGQDRAVSVDPRRTLADVIREEPRARVLVE